MLVRMMDEDVWASRRSSGLVCGLMTVPSVLSLQGYPLLVKSRVFGPKIPGNICICKVLSVCRGDFY